MQPKIISEVINLLKQLPGVGPKTAERFTYYLLMNPNLIEQFIDLFSYLKDKIVKCSMCNDFSDTDPCKICSDPERDKNVLCVVEHHQDMYAIKNLTSYKGLYYVLGYGIQPLNGKMPKDIDLTHLIKRIKDFPVKEVILATDMNTEGELTANFVVSKLRSVFGENIKFFRIARGLPSGAEIEYADSTTLEFALKNKNEIKE